MLWLVPSPPLGPKKSSSTRAYVLTLVRCLSDSPKTCSTAFHIRRTIFIRASRHCPPIANHSKSLPGTPTNYSHLEIIILVKEQPKWLVHSRLPASCPCRRVKCTRNRDNIIKANLSLFWYILEYLAVSMDILKHRPYLRGTWCQVVRTSFPLVSKSRGTQLWHLGSDDR